METQNLSMSNAAEFLSSYFHHSRTLYHWLIHMLDSSIKRDRLLSLAENLYKGTALVLLVPAPVNTQPLREIRAQYLSSTD